ncbi:flavodoxin [Vibrio paucivorans]|uniref:Flavodoxin n=1 Tax=Vibrio paucivorans TaxID=2829489 RepID=A0A9X3CFF0_9VIBR|nr:flavodoxin [Vibrio paucivorans]MCW8334879.1 flavodoxin [Vibrio paucivorans]
MSTPEIARLKNNWLFDHVNVKFPTKESLQGKVLYQARMDTATYEHYLEVGEQPNGFSLDDIYLVDFHRLTVMFALLQGQQWGSEEEKSAILEFFTQIIFSPPCDLFVGFKDGQPFSTAIVTKHHSTALVSDVFCVGKATDKHFVSAVLEKAKVSASDYDEILIEVVE